MVPIISLLSTAFSATLETKHPSALVSEMGL
jgi:hypothetical protein